MQCLEDLFGDVDNLSALAHPLSGARFRFLTDQTLLSLAERITLAITGSDSRTIIVSETGASPLAELCQWISTKMNERLNFQRLKFPREPIENIYPILAWYLTPEELDEALPEAVTDHLSMIPLARVAGLHHNISLTRDEALKQLCIVMPPDMFKTGATSPETILANLTSFTSSEFQRAARIILAGTRLQKLLAGPFVYFDEYIDSGTTLRNAVTFFGCFVGFPDMKLATYYLNSMNSDELPRVLIALSDARDIHKCHAEGAYPFENRIDLIGHFYRITSEEYRFTRVADIQLLLSGAEERARDCDDFLRTLESVSLNHQLLFELRHALNIDQLKTFFNEEHVLRHAIWQLELAHGNPDFAEFLFQAFDMYGPSWSPMPTDFHFDFWNAAKVLEGVLRAAPEYEILSAAYKAAREPLIKQIADIFQERRESWVERMKQQVEERYDSDRHQTVSGRYSGFSVIAG